MLTEDYEWITEFDHSKNLMIHKMTERVSVVSDIKLGVMKVFKDGIEIYSVEKPSITEYGNMLKKIYADALELDRFVISK